MTKTAVAAATPPPIDDLIESIDAMDGPALRAFIDRVRTQYNLPPPPREVQAWMQRTAMPLPKGDNTA